MRRKLDKKNGPLAAAVTLAAALSANSADAATTDLFDAADTTCGAALSALTGNSFEPGGTDKVLGLHDKELGDGTYSVVSTNVDIRSTTTGRSAGTNIVSALAAEVAEDGLTNSGTSRTSVFRGTATSVAYDVNTDILAVGDLREGGVFIFENFDADMTGGTDMTSSFVYGASGFGIAIDGVTGFIYATKQQTNGDIDVHEISSGTVGSAITGRTDIEGVGAYDGALVFNTASGIMQMANAGSTPTNLTDASGAQPNGEVLAVYGPNQLPLGSSLTPGYYTVYRDSSTNEVRYCFAPAATGPEAPELTALDDNLDMPISAGVSIPHDINAGDISLTAICEDSDATSPSELAIEIDANWGTGEPAYMTSRGTTSPASTAISIQEGFEMTPDQLGEVSLAVECMDGDGLVDEIRNASYVVSAPTASGELVYGSYYDFEESLLRAEADGASATGSEVTLVPEDGDMLTMDDLRDALVSFVVEDGGTIEFNTSGTSLDAQVTVFGISAGAAPEGQPAPPNAGSFEVNVSVQVEAGGTATMKFTDVDGTVLYDGPVEGELDFSNIEGGDDGSDTGSGSGSGSGTETGSGSGSEGGETDGGDDGLDGGSGEGAGGGTEQPQGNGGGCAVAPGTPASAAALLAALIAMARRRRQD